jgi:PAS domain S-box-containing protein
MSLPRPHEIEERQREPFGGFVGPPFTRAAGQWVVALVLLAAMFGLGLALGETTRGMPVIWPAAGVGIFLAYHRGHAAVAVIFVLTLVLGLYAFSSLWVGLGFALGSAVAAFAGGDLLRRWEVREPLERIRDILRFGLAVAVVAPLGSALFISLGLVLGGQVPGGIGLWRTFAVWWFAGALGSLVVSAFLFVWTSRRQASPRAVHWAEVLVWLVVLLAVEAFAFREWESINARQFPLEFLTFPLLLWSAVRYGQRGVTGGILITTLMAARSMTAFESDPFAPLYVWMFLGVGGGTALVLAAVFAEYRNREIEIRMNEERLRAFVRAIPDLAFVISDEGWYLDVFAPRASIFSERAQMLKGRALQDIYPTSLKEQFMKVIKEVLASGEVRVWRYVMDFRGKPHWFEGRVAPMEPIEGHPRSVFWVAYDITESQRANAALRERDRLLQAVTEAEATLLKTQDYQTGVRRTLEIIGKGIGLDRIEVFLLHPSAGGDVLRCDFLWNHRPEAGPSAEGGGTGLILTEAEFRGPWATLRGGSTWSLESRSDAPAKVTAHLPSKSSLSSLWVPIFVEDQFAGAIAFSVFREIGEWNDNARTVLLSLAGSLGGFIETKRIEDALKEAKRSADAANSAKSDFLAMMSHEIRTPMNAILGFTDLLEQSGLNDNQLEYARIISRSGGDLLDLINHILDFSKLESGPIQLEQTAFNLETTVMEVLEIMLMKAREKELRLEYEMDDESPRIYRGDPLRVRQILLNLVSNAVKFTPAGEVRVKVASHLVRPRRVCVHFAVRDTGIGIPADKMDDLFKAFTQVDSSTTREYGGTGLGLTICQRLAEKMEGRIWAESEPGVGSTFHVEIFLESETPEAPREKPVEAAVVRLDRAFAEHYPLRILLAEDDPRNTLLAREVLSQLGYVPTCVEDGRATEACLREGSFDVVLLDIHMAHVDGIKIAEHLRAGELGERNRGCVLIALTASVLLEDERRCLQAGINAFLGKPFSLADLLRELQKAHETLTGAG